MHYSRYSAKEIDIVPDKCALLLSNGFTINNRHETSIKLLISFVKKSIHTTHETKRSRD